MTKYAGEEFLNKIYKDLVNSEIVKHTGKGGNKNEDVHTYMERLERITNKSIEHDKLSLLKNFYYNKYVIKPENVPESYFKQQEQIALDRGYGHVHYTDEIKQREIEQIISEQKASLDLWIDYFASKDAEMYPTWFKYYCFQGMVRLGYFEKKEDKYTRRTESTVKPFIEINREAIAMLYDELIKVLNKENVDDKELEELLKSGSFSKIYAYCIKKIDSVKKDNTNSDEGIWKKYLQGSDPNILFNDIHGKGTGWCTAGGLETASSHLEGGDFYVYFTKDENGEYTCPRIAIRMEYKNIAEIRGIAENQNLESNMEKVVDKKLEEFPDKEKYMKKVKDMEMLTYIYTKWKKDNEVELSKEELNFLYETKEDIIGFGYCKDPRIEEIIDNRDIISDYNEIFKNIDEFTGHVQYLEETETVYNLTFPRKFNGHISFFNLLDAHNLKLPEIMNGSIRINRLTNAKGLILPEEMNGNLRLNSLTSVKNLNLPGKLCGSLELNNLTNAEGLTLPKMFEGDLELGGLISAKGLELPETIDGNLYLKSLTSVEGLVLPKKINGSLSLGKLTSAEGLVLPKTIDGHVNLRCLTNAEGLVLPEKINGYLDLSSLTNAKGLVLPKKINGSLSLKSLTSVEGLVLPEILKGDLYLDSLISVEDLELQKTLNGFLHLSSLTNAKGLVLPKTLNGSLDLRSLTNAKGLVLPKTLNGSLDLRSLTNVEGLVLPEALNGRLDLRGLTSAEGLVLPKKIEGDLDLGGLISAKGLELPKIINGSLSLKKLTSAKDLVLPETIDGFLRLSSLISIEELIIPKELNCKLICSLVNNDLNLLKQMCKENSIIK